VPDEVARDGRRALGQREREPAERNDTAAGRSAHRDTLVAALVVRRLLDVHCGVLNHQLNETPNGVIRGASGWAPPSQAAQGRYRYSRVRQGRRALVRTASIIAAQGDLEWF